MNDIPVFLCGILAFLFAIVYFLGKPFFIQKKYRDAPEIKTYMRQQGFLHLILGTMGIIYSFQEENYAIYNKPFAIVGGLIVIAVVVCIGISNHRFVNQAKNTEK